MPRKFKPHPFLLDENLTDQELLSKFLELGKRHLAPTTVENYERMLSYFFKYLGNNHLINDVNTELVPILIPWFVSGVTW